MAIATLSQSELAHKLEALIDATSLLQVVDALHDVCYAKAEHIAQNWQDLRAAKQWAQAGQWFARPNASVQSV